MKMRKVNSTVEFLCPGKEFGNGVTKMFSKKLCVLFRIFGTRLNVVLCSVTQADYFSGQSFIIL